MDRFWKIGLVLRRGDLDCLVVVALVGCADRRVCPFLPVSPGQSNIAVPNESGSR